jgi:Ca-activated chloride channel family protein
MSITGLLAVSGVPEMPLEARSRPVINPVNCALFNDYDYPRPMPMGSPRGGRIAPPIFTPSPTPPPPPPPPVPNMDRSVSAAKRPSMAQESTGPNGVASSAIGGPYWKPPYVQPPQNTERYAGKEVANIQRVAENPVSTFAVDVDTGSYTNVRRMLNHGQIPPEAAVRTEEMINYFRYDYPKPTDRNTPFSITTDLAQTPWNPDSRILRVGLRGYDAGKAQRPRANLVFLVDVSGSMRAPDKLPLVQSTLMAMADELRPDDRVSIVVYASAVGTLLAPTSNKAYIKQAVDCLQAGGATAGQSALKLAYQTARQNYDPDGINRIIMATDGDFNVGVSSTEELKDIVAKERESGVTMTMLGFGQGNIRDELMEGIANVGNGNYAYIDSAMEGKKVLVDEMSATLFTIAKDVKIQIEFNPALVSEYRLIGYENRLLAEEDFNNDKVDAGDIGAGHQVTALYEIMPVGANGWLDERHFAANRPKGNPSIGGEFAHIKLRYKLPDGDTSRLIERSLTQRLDMAAIPTGDMAFAIAVGAFGQKLRGDKYLGSFDFGDIERLSGNGGDFWRQEFRQLAQLVRSRS